MSMDSTTFFNIPRLFSLFLIAVFVTGGSFLRTLASTCIASPDALAYSTYEKKDTRSKE